MSIDYEFTEVLATEEDLCNPSHWRLCLVAQKGWIPWLIRIFTNSAWNHVAIETDCGNFIDLDRPGVVVHRREDYIAINQIGQTSLVSCSRLARERYLDRKDTVYCDVTNVKLILNRFKVGRFTRTRFGYSNCVGFAFRLLELKEFDELGFFPSTLEEFLLAEEDQTLL